MLAERAIVGQLETATDFFVDDAAVREPVADGLAVVGENARDRADRRAANPRTVEDDLLRLDELRAPNDDVERRAALRGAGQRRLDLVDALGAGFVRRRERERRDQQRIGEGESHASHANNPFTNLPSLIISIGRVPKATSSLSASMPS